MAGDGRNGDRAQDASGSRYDEELLSANWNPAIDLLGRSTAAQSQELTRARAEKLREEDVDAFLGRIYTLGA